MAAYDAWVTKLVRLLKKVGFEKQKGKKTRHQKWVLEASGERKKCTVIIQNKIPNGCRFDAVKEIRDNLKQAGADTQIVSQFDNFALGLIITDVKDDLEELEAKLADAFAANNSIAAAKIAMAIGTLVGDASYNSIAIAKREAELQERVARTALLKELEDAIRILMKVAFRMHLDRYDYYPINVNSYDTDLTPFDEDVSDTCYIQLSTLSPDDECSKLNFVAVGDLEKLLEVAGFRGLLAIELWEYTSVGSYNLAELPSFGGIHLCQSRLSSLDELEVLVKEVKSILTIPILSVNL